jgi:hypothetical protein
VSKILFFKLQIKLLIKKFSTDLLCVGKIALFDKALVSALACGALAMCAMWVGNCFKNVRWQKNKKHRVGLSVGFLVLSIFCISVLSQWFTFQFIYVGSVSYTWR